MVIQNDLKSYFLEKTQMICQNCNKKIEDLQNLILHRKDIFKDSSERNCCLVCRSCKKKLDTYYSNPEKRDKLENKINVDMIVLHDNLLREKSKDKKINKIKIKIEHYNAQDKFLINDEKDHAIVILDTNIVFQKIFSQLVIDSRIINTKIYEPVKQIFDSITNNEQMVLITPTVVDEINRIWIAMCDDFYYHKKIKKSKLRTCVKKKIEILIKKYSALRYFPDLLIQDKDKKEIIEMYNYFDEKIEAITNKKIQNLPSEVASRKLFHRNGGLQPESSDVDILCECKFMRRNVPDSFNKVILYSDDTDFTCFKHEISSLLHIEVRNTKDYSKKFNLV